MWSSWSSTSSSSEINTTTDTKDTTAVEAAAKELKSILLSKEHQRNENRKNNNAADRQERIEELMELLCRSKVSFDPMKCINGPLYAVSYQSGPVPFWEKYDLQRFTPGVKNIKGQRYTAASSSTSSSSSSSPSGFDVANYAEFWGDKLSIRVKGKCALMGDANTDTDTATAPDNNNSDDDEGNGSYNDNGLLTCPVTYKVKIQGASVSVLNKEFNLKVEGIGYARVMYADEEMRILLAPKDTTDERWMERSGLKVIQIRVDLIDPNFVLF